jgi:hypothetical protein
MILILEDNADRVRRFRTVLARIAPALPVQLWRSARVMVRELEPFLAKAVLLSLDHDLDPLDGDVEDPGDGLDVVKFLAERQPVCPVIVHSSNGPRADWMMGDLELAGWAYWRVAPLGEDWIEQSWRRVARRLLRPSAAP